jgi:hypothetical protein
MTEVVLRRYTNLAATINTLRHKKITLLDPASWDDRNDAYFLSQYRKRKPARTVLALCFALAPETYHHWRVFSQGTDGVCIEFDKDKLLHALQGCKELRAEPVIYKEIKEVRASRPNVDELPFLKRYPYRDEREFRLIYTDTNQDLDVKELDIPIECIRRVTLSPWLHASLSESVKATLSEIEGCKELAIYRSQLIEYEKWKRVARGEEP